MLLQLLVLVHSQAGAYHFLAHPAQQEQRVALVQQVSKAFKDRQEAQEPLVLALKVRLAQQVRLA
jgi:DNA-binding cell septation regulator SpoVG